MINLSQNDMFLDNSDMSDYNVAIRNGQVRALDRIREAFVAAVNDYFGSDGDDFLKEIGLLRTYTFEGSVSIEGLDEDEANDIQSMWDSFISDVESTTTLYVSSDGGYLEE